LSDRGEEDEDEEVITQTISPALTNTWTDFEENLREIKCWTVSFTTYNDPDLRRYEGNENCIGFTDIERREGESCNTPSFHTLHMNLREVLLFVTSDSSPHIETYAPPETNKLVLRNTRITFWELKVTTGRFEEEDTTNVLDLFPQDERKLHKRTSNEYTDPSDKKRRGMMMGEVIKEDTGFDEGSDVRFKRYSWRREVLGEAEREEDGEGDVDRIETWNDKVCHFRPPDPEEELKSNNKSSHTPNSLGIDKVTKGGVNNSGEGEEILREWDSL
jgi:hypothetical protein